ncbi:DUF2752 domain-containing protein [Mucilaginibacter corticis]|uniref:DUF2752 domain-containing protein n=2 Tax=Mucilaginibacter corticis TaxID=2597670 RepID=A0A556MSN5_9SPHI|nr:DUF2752 domain-containing protein [Mucilaginibacter corticis]
MLLNMIFCSYLSVIKWLQNNLIPCPFKKLTGIDCPGCGFQRSLIFLLQGNLKQSVYMYPAAIPIIITVIIALTAKIAPATKQSPLFFRYAYTFTGVLITASYLFKIINRY